jgi:hypothetical protein
VIALRYIDYFDAQLTQAGADPGGAEFCIVKDHIFPTRAGGELVRPSRRLSQEIRTSVITEKFRVSDVTAQCVQ